MKNSLSTADIKANLRFWLIFICIGLGGSLVYRHLQDASAGNAPQPTATLQETTPLAGSDAFALHLFQREVAASPGNILTAPVSLAILLHQWRELGDAELQQRLASLALPERFPQTSHVPVVQEALFVDNRLTLPNTPAHQQLIRLPFHDLPRSFSLIINLMGQVGSSPIQLELGKESPIQPGIQLLAISQCSFQPEFQYPFEEEANTTGEFDNDNGGLPTIQMMNNRGLYRRAAAADGSWEAIALPCKPQANKGDTLYFIAILPAGKARDMAMEMTVAQLTAIRQALADAPPQPWGVSLPEMRSLAGTRSLEPLLQRLGLGDMFKQPGCFPLPNQKSLSLGAALQHLDFRLQARRSPRGGRQQAEPPLQSNTLIFNRPFLWMVGDLSSEAPPFLMGLVENF